MQSPEEEALRRKHRRRSIRNLRRRSGIQPFSLSSVDEEQASNDRPSHSESTLAVSCFYGDDCDKTNSLHKSHE